MDTSEIEAWAMQVVERVRSGKQLEDRRVELKRQWPAPQAGSHAKTARQLAGLANANHPEPVLWLVGIDERERQVVGANAIETARWWSMVGSCFDGDPPDLADVVVAVGDRTVVALCFDTTTAPYVVKNPLHGTAGHVIASEVPWREGTRVRTIRKHELRTLLLPRPVPPEIKVHGAALTQHSRPGGQGEPEAGWSGEMTWSVESLVPKRLTLPVHRMRLSVEFPHSGSVASFEPIFTDARMLGSSDGSPDVRCTGDYVIIDGPGIIRTHLTGPNPPPPPSAEGPATITLTMPATGLPTPIVIQADLHPQQPATPGQTRRWLLTTQPD